MTLPDGHGLIRPIVDTPTLTVWRDEDGYDAIEFRGHIIYRRHRLSAPLHAATDTATHSQGDAS